MSMPLIIPWSGNPWIDWGVPLWGFVSPTDYSDPYAQTIDILQQGGYQVHQTTASMDAIILERRKFGMEVMNIETNKAMRLCDSTHGGVDNDIMNNANWIEIAWGGGGNFATTLALGNQTSGNNIITSGGDYIVSAANSSAYINLYAAWAALLINNNGAIQLHDNGYWTYTDTLFTGRTGINGIVTIVAANTWNSISLTVDPNMVSNAYWVLPAGYGNPWDVLTTDWNIGVLSWAPAWGGGGLVGVTNANNTFLGVNAWNLTLTGTKNVGIGDLALYQLTSAWQNTAVWYHALSNNITGWNNSAFWYNALNANTVTENTGIGSRAGEATTTGVQNVFIGSAAGVSNISGHGNVYMGCNAWINTNAHNNTAVGYISLFNNANGGNNTAFGSGALYGGFVSINDNTAIGYHAGYNCHGNSNVFVGNLAGATHGTGYNQLWIDNWDNVIPLIFGDFSGRYIGIGTVTPSTKLHIASATPGALRIADGTEAAGYVLTSDVNGVGTRQVAWGGGGPIVTTGSGSPVWVVTPTMIGDRYIDLTGPTVYTAYWLTNTERIS